MRYVNSEKIKNNILSANDLIGTKCKRGYKIEICSSASGFYIGTIDPEDNFPNCRISRDYYATEEEARESEFVLRLAPENEFCNRHNGCIDY